MRSEEYARQLASGFYDMPAHQAAQEEANGDGDTPELDEWAPVKLKMAPCGVVCQAISDDVEDGLRCEVLPVVHKVIEVRAMPGDAVIEDVKTKWPGTGRAHLPPEAPAGCQMPD